MEEKAKKVSLVGKQEIIDLLLTISRCINSILAEEPQKALETLKKLRDNIETNLMNRG